MSTENINYSNFQPDWWDAAELRVARELNQYLL